ARHRPQRMVDPDRAAAARRGDHPVCVYVPARHSRAPPLWPGARAVVLPRAPRRGLLRLGDPPAQQIDLAVQRHHEPVDAFTPQYRIEFGAVYRELADRAVEIDVGDLPGALAAAHSVVEGGRLTLGVYDLCLHDHVRTLALLAGHLELLARAPVEPADVSRRLI